MTNKLMQWHLARDNQIKLAKFCDKHQVNRNVSPYYKHEGLEDNYFTMTTIFDNGGFITAESKQGGSLAENYQVMDYGWGNK